MLRDLFIEFPDDPGSWLIDDEYMFGSDILVAPLFEDVKARNVYLPLGEFFSNRGCNINRRDPRFGNIPAVVCRNNTLRLYRIYKSQ
ncbi:MAG: hypothetical protein WCE54_24140 [Ignavibacteriaceae bacterium]